MHVPQGVHTAVTSAAARLARQAEGCTTEAMHNDVPQQPACQAGIHAVNEPQDGSSASRELQREPVLPIMAK